MENKDLLELIDEALLYINKEWRPNWNDDKQIKYCIVRQYNCLTDIKYKKTYCKFAFPNRENLQKFQSMFPGLLYKYYEL